MSNVSALLTLAAIVGSGVMAGLFLIFSNATMKALNTLPPAQAISAMQAINRIIINPVFLSFFIGTTLCSLSLLGLSIQGGDLWTALGAGIYLVGGFFITVRCNVPLNDQLAAFNPNNKNAPEIWSHYLRHWLQWNHVRTLSCLLAASSFAAGTPQEKIPPPTNPASLNRHLINP